MTLLSSTLAACCILAAAVTSTPQASAAPVTTQVDRPAELRRDLVFTVDPLGTGDFVDLPTAIAEVPGQSLLLLKPGLYSGATVDNKSLRIESVVPQAAQIMGPLIVENIGPNQDVYLSGLFFRTRFWLRQCEGEVSLFGCGNEMSGMPDLPAGWNYCSSACGPQHCDNDVYLTCGCRVSRHRIELCEGVSLVDCELSGRNGDTTVYDGAPGEHAIEVDSSRVSIYGGLITGGNGGESIPSFYAFPGSAGDGIRAGGPLTVIRSVGSMIQGGEAGYDYSQPACPGRPVALADGAQYTPGPANSVSLVLQPLVRPGTAAGYVISAPSGATILLNVGTSRTWRDFPADVGVLHVQSPFETISLGTMGPSGVMQGSIPAMNLEWSGAFLNLELQVYAIVGGQDRLSEPRTLHVTSEF